MATRGSNRWRLDEWGKPCELQTVAAPIYAGGPKCHIRREIRPAYILLGAVFLRHGYIVKRIGGYNCRQITGGTVHSSHSWGISADVNDDTNPYRRDKLVTDMLYAMIEDVYRVRTLGGVQAWRWGGDWDGRPGVPNSNYDAMHFEIVATPTELARGFAAVILPDHSASAHEKFYPVIRQGANGPAVAELQKLLGMQRLGTGEGKFGPRTHQTVQTYQASRGLEPDGIAGSATWTALLTKQPPLSACTFPPQKKAA